MRSIITAALRHHYLRKSAVSNQFYRRYSTINLMTWMIYVCNTLKDSEKVFWREKETLTAVRPTRVAQLSAQFTTDCAERHRIGLFRR